MEEILSEGIPQKYKEQSNMDEIITISRGNTRGSREGRSLIQRSHTSGAGPRMLSIVLLGLDKPATTSVKNGKAENRLSEKELRHRRKVNGTGVRVLV